MKITKWQIWVSIVFLLGATVTNGVQSFFYLLKNIDTMGFIGSLIGYLIALYFLTYIPTRIMWEYLKK